MPELITKIKENREKAGMKQSELADLVHVRRETIVHLENGKYNPSLKLALDIAHVFNTTVEELFEFQEAAEPAKAGAAKAEPVRAEAGTAREIEKSPKLKTKLTPQFEG